MSFKFNNTGPRLDVSQVQKYIRDKLFTLLEKCPGDKIIIWDLEIWGPLRLSIPIENLRQHGVIKVFSFTTMPARMPDTENVIFITRPKLHLIDCLSDKIKEDSRRVTKKYHLFFVPRESLLCMKRLEKNGVLGNFKNIDEFKCHIFPFDSDLITMEMPEVYREVALNYDPTCLYEIAQTILFLQSIYGRIGQIWGKGSMSHQVWQLVDKLQREQSRDTNSHYHLPHSPIIPLSSPHPTSAIDQLILIDRSIDLVTPLVTQLTYEGLIDELFGIRNAVSKFPAVKLEVGKDGGRELEQSMAVMEVDEFQEYVAGGGGVTGGGSKGEKEREVEVMLTSGELFYGELRDRNFNAVGAFLSKQAKDISSLLEDRHGKSIQELKVFVQSLRTLADKKKALSQHTAIAECIKEITDTCDFLDRLRLEQEFLNCIDGDRTHPQIEDMIAQRQPLLQVLRLVSLQCVTNSGLKPRVLEQYCRALVDTYDVSVWPWLSALQRAGLLRQQATAPRQYAVLRKTLRLTTEDVSEINPTDISYVHSVYAPLTIRIVEQVIKPGGCRQLQDVLGLLPGPKLDETQATYTPRDSTNNTSEKPKLVLVFFIGGCTFAEISALRFLSQQEDSNVEFIIATTALINGNKFIQSISNIDYNK